MASNKRIDFSGDLYYTVEKFSQEFLPLRDVYEICR